ncbi:hypothetical protein EVAR_49416_1 [Eumeta japonica]|uniref:Uncharacterized protein n=1 Tax=Eumeta variegata TaxID=151549 RepID=A0A4C1Y975_EUMVA|nr:hypothetical protein EVAR_49416_1 [Eumeta japonica]
MDEEPIPVVPPFEQQSSLRDVSAIALFNIYGQLVGVMSLRWRRSGLGAGREENGGGEGCRCSDVVE